MFDLTYLLGMLKNVATGGVGGDRKSGGSTRLANILDEFDADNSVVFFELKVHCTVNSRWCESRTTANRGVLCSRTKENS
jgi:hypothetical protein